MELILEWLLREAEPGTGILNLHKIRSVALCDELIYFNDNGNFDRIMALIYTLILHEERWKHKPEFDDSKKIKVHPFFSNNPIFNQNQNINKRTIIKNEQPLFNRNINLKGIN